MGIWVKVPGYATPGGDPVWACPKCGGTEHVNGIETVNYKLFCENCRERNYYPWEEEVSENDIHNVLRES